jgi:flagellar hook-length control protein FliK
LKDAKFSEEASEGKTLSVHVVAQQAWLQPVSPVFSPGLRRQAAADRAALETPQAAGKIENTARGNVEVTDKDAPPAVATKFPGPSANPAPEKTPPSSSAPCSPSGGNFASDRSEPPKPAAAVAPPSDEPRPNLAAAPKKNLEITLAPKELGGLEVRMKSAGDRLELGFVADRGETARLISDRSATLTSQLQGAGIGLGGIDISSAAAGQGASGDAPTGGDRDSNPAPQRQHTSGRDRQDGNNEIDDQTGDAPSRGRRGFYL